MGINREDARDIYEHHPELLIAYAKALKDDNAREGIRRIAKALFTSLQYMGLDVTGYLS